MIFTFDIKNRSFSIDTSEPIVISIPVIFNGDQPNTYNVEKASAEAYVSGEFVGDTRRGGGCNFEVYRIIPHCNGTHTECVGHISFERIFVNRVMTDSFIPATLISVEPQRSGDTVDSYIPPKNKNDLIISRKILEEKLFNADKDFLEALIIRTLPNDDSKKHRNYMNYIPAYFSLDAMKYISELNVDHLLLDIPSVDRTFDEGKLSAHHIFWNVPFESHEVNANDHSMKTITEMIYAGNEVEDGIYMASIQIPDFRSDAAPSRILLYKPNLK